MASSNQDSGLWNSNDQGAAGPSQGDENDNPPPLTTLAQMRAQQGVLSPDEVVNVFPSNNIPRAVPPHGQPGGSVPLATGSDSTPGSDSGNLNQDPFFPRSVTAPQPVIRFTATNQQFRPQQGPSPSKLTNPQFPVYGTTLDERSRIAQFNYNLSLDDFSDTQEERPHRCPCEHLTSGRRSSVVISDPGESTSCAKPRSILKRKRAAARQLVQVAGQNQESQNSEGPPIPTWSKSLTIKADKLEEEVRGGDPSVDSMGVDTRLDVRGRQTTTYLTHVDGMPTSGLIDARPQPSRFLHLMRVDRDPRRQDNAGSYSISGPESSLDDLAGILPPTRYAQAPLPHDPSSSSNARSSLPMGFNSRPGSSDPYLPPFP